MQQAASPLYTSYFISPCIAWSRRSTMQQAASPLRLYFISLHTSYHHALHGGDAVRCSRLPLHCVSTLHFTLYFRLHDSDFVPPPLVMPALRSFAKVDLETQCIY
jgi:hypothetical protein